MALSPPDTQVTLWSHPDTHHAECRGKLRVLRRYDRATRDYGKQSVSGWHGASAGLLLRLNFS
jgi:hypothetical protein